MISVPSVALGPERTPHAFRQLALSCYVAALARLSGKLSPWLTRRAVVCTQTHSLVRPRVSGLFKQPTIGRSSESGIVKSMAATSALYGSAGSVRGCKLSGAESEVGAQLRIRITARRETSPIVRSSTQPRSMLSVAAWAYLGPLVAIGALALFVFGFGVFAVVMQLVAAMLKHAGI
jgi:hypothetical protein